MQRLSSTLLMVLALSASAAAQTATPPPAGLHAEPLVAESLGLTMYPPAGALMREEKVEGRATIVLLDGEGVPAWSMRIQPLVMPFGAPKGRPGDRIAELLEAWRNQGLTFRMLHDAPVAVDGRAGHLAYVEQEAEPGETSVSGWLVLEHENREFLVFAVQIAAAEYANVRGVIDASFATIRLRAATEVAEGRKMRLDAGREFLAGIGRDRLRGLTGPQRWFRHYVPALASGEAEDEELGYFSVEFRDGMLGEVEPNRDPSSFGPDERESGLLVAVQGHYLEAATNSTYASEARYWMAWDQSHEAWSIRGTRRWGRKSRSEAQTGFRTPRSTGDPSGTLIVVASNIDGTTRDQESWRVPDVYLSQPIRWALGALLPRDRPEQPLVFGTYCFDSTAPKLATTLRIDTWECTDRTRGHWTLTSQSRPNVAKIVSEFDAGGRLVRRTWPGGPVAEPIDVDDLHELWKRKGLPTGPRQP
jgi:hypothetical protein